MNRDMSRRVFGVTLASLLGVGLVDVASAKTLKLQADGKRKAEDIASPSDIKPVQAVEPIPQPQADPIPLHDNGLVRSDCQKCGDRCIKYKKHITLRKTCKCCDDPVETILEVKDPCCCCTVDIPICLPGCCKDAPKVCAGSGIFGRNVVEYEWCCGFRVKIVFDRCGDITVHTFGR